MNEINAHSKKVKLFRLMVNGNTVYRWAISEKHARALVRIDALRKYGRYNITDCKMIRNRT